jgi:hypothetical protein
LVDSIWFEFITKELIDGLSQHIINIYPCNVNILEVWAWNGKLAHYLSQSLSKHYGDNFIYNAIDRITGDWIKIHKLDQQEGIQKFSPNIILCSWLELHPYTLYPVWLYEERQKLADSVTLLEEEKKITIGIIYGL